MLDIMKLGDIFSSGWNRKGESRGALTPTAFWCKNEEIIAR
jgi:hypothetical protein